MGNVAKDASNPFFHSKYAPLESILPAIKKPLEESGLIFTQIPTGLCKLTTTIIDVESGETISGEYEMTPAKNDPQGQGGAITYMRRYALVSMLGLNCDVDDDGNTASTPAKKPVKASISPKDARKNADIAIDEADTIEALNSVNANVQKSKNLSDKDKQELSFMVSEKLQTLDPLE